MAIEPGAGAPATRLQLEAVSPNPFAPGTRVTFTVAEAGRLELAIYDAAGRPVAILVDEVVAGGRHVATWDGRNGQGVSVAAGVHFARLAVESEVEIAKLVLTR